MRIWMTLLLTISTLTALSLGLWYMNRDSDRPLEPRIQRPRAQGHLEVFHGALPGREVLLIPAEGSPQEQSFHGRQWDRLLGGRGKWRVGRLWLVNLGEDAIPFDPHQDAVLHFRGVDDQPVRSCSLLDVPRESDVAPTAADQLVLNALSQAGRREIGPHEFVEIALAWPRSFDAAQSTQMQMVTWKVDLTLVKARSSDLAAFKAHPRGTLKSLLIAEDRAEVQQPASRPKEEGQ